MISSNRKSRNLPFWILLFGLSVMPFSSSKGISQCNEIKLLSGGPLISIGRYPESGLFINLRGKIFPVDPLFPLSTLNWFFYGNIINYADY